MLHTFFHVLVIAKVNFLKAVTSLDGLVL